MRYFGCDATDLMGPISENFSEMPESLRDEDKIVSATGTASIGFISCEDIAQVAVDCLLAEPPHCTEHIIVGPELLSFNEVAPASCPPDMLTNI